MEGTILDKTGSVSFRIRLSDGHIWKRHIDHIRIRYPEDSIAPNVPEALVGPEQFSGSVKERLQILKLAKDSPHLRWYLQ